MLLTLPQIYNLYTKYKDPIDHYLANGGNIREDFKKLTREDLDNVANVATFAPGDGVAGEGAGEGAAIGVIVTVVILSLVIFILLVVGLVRGRRRGMPTGWLILGILGFFIPPLQIATIIIVIYYNFIHKPNTHVFKPLKKMI